MHCNVIMDLIPLYIDGCCSEVSSKIVEEHLEHCPGCKMLLEDMKRDDQMVPEARVPVALRKINDWKASVLQSVLLFVSFAAITIGVTLEAKSPTGQMNGFWTFNLIIPATGLMLSLANWYFVRSYKSRKCFSNCSAAATAVLALCGYVWSFFHYGSLLFLYGPVLTVVFCLLSKILSNQYAKMLGKE